MLSLWAANVKCGSHPDFAAFAPVWSAPSLEDFLAKTNQHNGSALAPCPSTMSQRQSKYTGGVLSFFPFFLSFLLYQRSQGKHWSSHGGLCNSVHGICLLKHHWRKVLAQLGEIYLGQFSEGMEIYWSCCSHYRWHHRIKRYYQVKC